MGKQNPLLRFFGVWVRGQTYLNLLYLVLAFPLGLAYLIFFLVGIALGLPLTILLVGFIILVFVALGWWVFASFERLLAIWLLRINIPPMDKPGPKPQGIWDKFINLLTNPVTWKSLIYLVVKLPLGILSFIALVLLGGVSLALLISPLTFWWMPITVELTGQRTWAIDTAGEALLGFLIGILFASVSLHIFNYLAYISALWAQLMLGNARPEPATAHLEQATRAQLPIAVPLELETVPEPEPIFIPGPELNQVPEYPLGTTDAQDMARDGFTPEPAIGQADEKPPIAIATSDSVVLPEEAADAIDNTGEEARRE